MIGRLSSATASVRCARRLARLHNASRGSLSIAQVNSSGTRTTTGTSLLHYRCRTPSRLSLTSARHCSTKAPSSVSSSAEAATSTAGAATAATVASSRPPLLLRLGIVGSSITLGTPVFTLAGILRIWSNVLPQSVEGVAIKRLIGLLIGGGSVTLTYYFIYPFMRDYPDLILPFALSNGAAVMFWQLLAELTVGLDRLAGSAAELSSQLPSVAQRMAQTRLWSHLPLGGAALGLLTSLTAPLLWGKATDLCWSAELKRLLLDGDSVTWLQDIYYGVAIPVAIPVGVLAGSSLHMLLKPFVMGAASSGGVAAMPWYTSSLPFFLAVTSISALYFGTARLRGGGVQIEDFLWMQRMDAKTGADISVNMRTGQIEEGNAQALKTLDKITLVKALHGIRDPLKDLRESLGKLFSWGSAPNTVVVSSPSNTRTPMAVTSASVTVDNYADRVDFFRLVDVLIRWRHLLSTGCKESSPDMVALNQRAEQLLGLRDVGRVLQAAEVGCVAIRRHQRLQQQAVVSEALGLSANTAGDVVSKHSNIIGDNDAFIQGVKRRILESHEAVQGNDASQRGAQALRLLADNMPVLEAELVTQLGYSIAEPSEGKDLAATEAALIAKYSKEVRFEGYISTALQAVKIAAVASAVGYVIYFLVGGGDSKP